jgi:hypothetical protein
VAHLAYYVKERAAVALEIPEVAEARIPFEAAVGMIRQLARENAVKIAKVRATHGRRSSKWDPWARVVILHCDAAETVSLRTAIHEFCHALDGKLRPHSARWHDSIFMSIVLDYCRVARARGWHLPTPPVAALSRSPEVTP